MTGHVITANEGKQGPRGSITKRLPRRHSLYRVVKKKVLHKSEGKMPKKMKMTLQRAENLVHVKQHYCVPFA